MKFNLKNRPDLKQQDNTLAMFELYFDLTEKWFEGFEEELRSMMPLYVQASKVPMYHWQRKLIKEILGE